MLDRMYSIYSSLSPNGLQLRREKEGAMVGTPGEDRKTLSSIPLLRSADRSIGIITDLTTLLFCSISCYGYQAKVTSVPR